MPTYPLAAAVLSVARDWRDWLWLGLHGCGAVAGHLFGLWPYYWSAFVVVEAVGLAGGFPYTLSVRRFLAHGTGPGAFVRAVLVAVWCGWLIGTGYLYGPGVFDALGLRHVLGPGLLVLGVWLVHHFFTRLEERRRRVRRDHA